MEKKYIIECTEEQLSLIAECVEDCHRFMAGQTELSNITIRLDNSREICNKLKEIKSLVTPKLNYNASYDWSGHSCPNDLQRMFIAKTYPIYREILHFFAAENVFNNVYNSPTLTCEEGGDPIKISIKEEKV